MKGGIHPFHQQRSHLIVANHGGSGSLKANIVPLTSGTNHPGMRRAEDIVTAHVNKGNTVLIEVVPIYRDGQIEPVSVKMYAVDQNMKVILYTEVKNGTFQNNVSCGCNGKTNSNG